MISKNYYLYLLIFFSWNWVTVQAADDALSLARIGSAASLLHDQIYFFGGSPVNDTLEQTFALSLNLSIPFDIASPPWKKLEIENPSLPAFMSSDIVNTENPVIYIFANTDLPKTTVTVYKFNENALSLENVMSQGNLPLSRYEVSAISDDEGNFYLFGGGIINTSPNVRSNEMNIYGSLSNIWSVNVVPPGGALPILGYSATFLDGLILYIGGRSGTFMDVAQTIDAYPFNTIHVYDTKSGSWSIKQAINGDQIMARMSHTAVLTTDKRIIMYGGTTWDKKTVKPDLAVLNVNSDKYEWSVPMPNNPENAPPPLTSHSAMLYENHMIIAFGVTTPSLIAPKSNIYLLDTQSYTWLNHYDPPKSTSSTDSIPTSNNSTYSVSTSSNNSQESNIKPLLIAVVVIVPVSIAIGIIVAYFMFKRHRTEKERPIPTPGSVSEASQSLPKSE
ncbi:hypothetical protein RclHR1_01360014 [Rhizophagus clarus]|uniref:Attractin/MKLN-like beta-propeller domain-containing protein n=1 Tax=Rhizophagus clarus TaxID=94130 RepID=A0A2Z6QAF1_9GLOM|nr:hypothetical protein RclHR1_01360014 [Rhizophagus clarus]GES74535.1 hypothetical protein GLOIN_2v1470756 [Rhizophagus clarus]